MSIAWVGAMLGVLHAAVATALSALALQTLLNLRSLPRLERMPPPPAWPRLAVLIPARNEAAGIAACVRRWASQDYPDFEVVVYDDESTDYTAARAEAAAASSPHVRVLRGGPLPPGWTGKARGCHRLREAVRADVLVFADADVSPAPETLRGVAAAVAALGVDGLSALPTHRSASLAVRAIVALQHWAALTFVPLWAHRLRKRPIFTVTNGQLLAIRAEAYDAVGGFASVAASLGEDAALGRRLAAGGHAIALVDGARLLECHPYPRVRDAWRANVRNLATIFVHSTPLLLLAMAGLALLYLAPVGVLAAGLARGAVSNVAWTWAALAEVALALVPRALVDRRARHPALLAALHPLAVAALIATGVESALRCRGRGGVEWRGRRYNITPTPPRLRSTTSREDIGRLLDARGLPRAAREPLAELRRLALCPLHDARSGAEPLAELPVGQVAEERHEHAREGGGRSALDEDVGGLKHPRTVERNPRTGAGSARFCGHVSRFGRASRGRSTWA